MLWCIVLMHVPCCITIMMSPFVIACHHEKCRIPKDYGFCTGIDIGCSAPLLWKQKLATRVIYIWDVKSLVHVHHIFLMYLHQ